ncbi:hypothetical protein Cni_G03365 [Canna indica]|uniref:Uncharacterized protein n=1 Tax=Canna indica TaxID=4628 RepID=A0AAQ3Q301_9LILI|nr:hypothetical protein Cni_G03365 [Canna indica]
MRRKTGGGRRTGRPADRIRLWVEASQGLRAGGRCSHATRDCAVSGEGDDLRDVLRLAVARESELGEEEDGSLAGRRQSLERGGQRCRVE